PGDYLTFYTDGVTEAFSPEGEMFGEANLQRIIRAQAQSEKVDETAVGAAQEMIDAIDDAVSDFLEDGFLADDLTLLVLKRIGQT
ncbi:MAG TPA: SpoIIE family protein phosphatase, partial [Anaerolineales bacterium]